MPFSRVLALFCVTFVGHVSVNAKTAEETTESTGVGGLCAEETTVTGDTRKEAPCNGSRATAGESVDYDSQTYRRSRPSFAKDYGREYYDDSDIDVVERRAQDTYLEHGLEYFRPPNSTDNVTLIYEEHNAFVDSLLRLMRNPIEIKGLPETRENALRIVRRFGRRIGIEDVYSVTAAFRLPKPTPDVPGSRRIIADLQSKARRREWLKQSNAFREVTAKDMDPRAPPDPIYVNEFLSRPLRALLLRVKNFARRVGYPRIWVKEGIVFVAKAEFTQARPIRIASELDLRKFVYEQNV